MPQNTRTTISTDELLKAGGINGLLKQVKRHKPSDANVSGPFLALDDDDEVEEKVKPDKDELPPAITVKSEDTTSENAQSKASKVKPEQPKKDIKTPKKNALSFQSLGKGSEEEWNEILTMLKDYRHAIDRKKDRQVFIDGDILEVLRTCFGIRTSWLINIIARRFIEANKERLKAMYTKQCRLLK